MTTETMERPSPTQTIAVLGKLFDQMLNEGKDTEATGLLTYIQEAVIQIAQQDYLKSKPDARLTDFQEEYETTLAWARYALAQSQKLFNAEFDGRYTDTKLVLWRAIIRGWLCTKNLAEEEQFVREILNHPFHPRGSRTKEQETELEKLQAVIRAELDKNRRPDGPNKLIRALAQTTNTAVARNYEMVNLLGKSFARQATAATHVLSAQFLKAVISSEPTAYRDKVIEMSLWYAQDLTATAHAVEKLTHELGLNKVHKAEVYLIEPKHVQLIWVDHSPEVAINWDTEVKQRWHSNLSTTGAHVMVWFEKHPEVTRFRVDLVARPYEYKVGEDRKHVVTVE